MSVPAGGRRPIEPAWPAALGQPSWGRGGAPAPSPHPHFSLLRPLQEHQALLAKVREGETALEELRSQSADCRAEQEK